jgi:ribosome-associated protein
MPHPMNDLTPLALACHAASLCAGKSAEGVTVLRLPEGAEFQYVVLATARSERQAYTLVDEVFGFCKRRKIAHRPVEGEAGWYLIDCYSVVVHALGEAQRSFYAFERLWRKADSVDWQAELAKLPALPALPASAASAATAEPD